MPRPRDIVQDFTVIEVTEGKFEGMRGWMRSLEFDADYPDKLKAVVELVGRNESIHISLPLTAIRPADPQTIGTGEE